MYSDFTIYHELMARKVRDILLVSSPYDAFIMEEGGSLATRIIEEYQGLNLSEPPRLRRVSTATEALGTLSLASAIQQNSTLLFSETSTLHLQATIDEESKTENAPSEPEDLIKQVIAAHQDQMTKAPTNADIHYKYGILMMVVSNTDDAIRSFENALKINKDDSWYFALLGMKEEFIKSDLNWRTERSNTNRSGYLILINNHFYKWVKDDPRIQEFMKKEKKKYEMLKAKYGNLDFLDL